MDIAPETNVMRTDRVVNTRFTPATYDQIVEVAEREDRTVSYMIRKWVTEALAAEAASHAGREAA